VVNNSGPGFVTSTEGEAAGTIIVTFDFKGRSAFFAEGAVQKVLFAAAGLPEFFVTSGPLRGTLVLDISQADEDTPPTTIDVDFETPQRVQDVCALLT
jgi:hypothetical protein